MLRTLLNCFRGTSPVPDGKHGGTSSPPTYEQACAEWRLSPSGDLPAGTVEKLPQAKRAPVPKKLASCSEQRQQVFEEAEQPPEHIHTGIAQCEPDEKLKSKTSKRITEQSEPATITESKPAREAIDYMKSLDYDDSRLKALQMILSRITRFTAREAIDLIGSFDYDNSRLKALQTILSRINRFTAREAIDLIGSFDYDDSRLKALQMILSRITRFTAREAIDLGRSFDYDDSRTRALKMVESK